MVTNFIRFAIVAAIVGLTAGCANTIRGVGQDAANTVDATQNAGNNVANSVD